MTGDHPDGRRPRLRRKARAIAITCGVLALVVAFLAGGRRLARSRTYQLVGDLVARVETREAVVALTFDDGPADGIADTLIRVLGERGARATFFVMGSGMADSPAAGRRLVETGHESLQARGYRVTTVSDVMAARSTDPE